MWQINAQTWIKRSWNANNFNRVLSETVSPEERDDYGTLLTPSDLLSQRSNKGEDQSKLRLLFQIISESDKR